MKIIFAIILACLCLNNTEAAEERIWFNAKINGQPVRFAFDTGTDANFLLYSTTAKRLGLKVTPPNPNQKIDPGKTAFGTTESCNLDVGVTNARTSLGVIEAPTYAIMPGDGLVGWPALSNNIIHLDVAADIIDLLTNVPIDTSKWTQFCIPDSDDLTLELSANKNTKLILAIDSGSFFGVKLNSQKWSDWKSSHKNQPSTFESYYTPNPGFVIIEESWADKISMGSLTLTDVPVMEADSTDSVLHSSPQLQYEATLGLAALKRLDMVIDGKRAIAYLRPKKTPPLPYQHNRFGADFLPTGSNDDLIAHVVPDGPAYEAGIRNGDIVLKEGDRDVTKWRTDTNPPPAIRPVQQPAGTKLELTLKRGDKIFKTTAILRNILPPDAVKNSN
jgi:PDZ domain/Aspartyl protease